MREHGLICQDLRTVAEHLDGGFDLACIQAADLIEAQHAALNTPETRDFVAGVMREVPHQRERWGSDHDKGKGPLDWFWLVGYLAQKVVEAQRAGDADKALHHTISTAAAMANWHAAITGDSTLMRPGTDR